MRHQLILATAFLFAISASASIPKVADCHKKSDELLKKASTQKTEKEKAETLLSLKTFLEKSRDDYEQKFPEGGNKEEYQVSLFYHKLEPVFKLSALAKKDKDICEETNDRIRANDAQGRGDDVPLTKNASIALDWLKVFCK